MQRGDGIGPRVLRFRSLISDATHPETATAPTKRRVILVSSFGLRLGFGLRISIYDFGSSAFGFRGSGLWRPFQRT